MGKGFEKYLKEIECDNVALIHSVKYWAIWACNWSGLLMRQNFCGRWFKRGWNSSTGCFSCSYLHSYLL